MIRPPSLLSNAKARPRRAPFALLAALVSGCVAPGANLREPPAPAQRSATAAPLLRWVALPERALVDAFRARAAKFLRPEDARLLATLCEREAVLAHHAFLAAEDPALRAGLSRGLGHPAYAASEAARAASPAEHARARASYAQAVALAPVDRTRARRAAEEAAAGFRDCGDRLRAGAAQALACGLALEERDPTLASSEPVVPAQRAAAALLALGSRWLRGERDPEAAREAADRALEAGDDAVLRCLEEDLACGLVDPAAGAPDFALRWEAGLARAALRRGEALRALAHAQAALRRSEALGHAPSAARLRLAQAHLAAGRPDPALAVAQEALEAAEGPSAAAAAQSVLAEALLHLGRPEAAAARYARAQEAAERAGDDRGALRAGVNRAFASLRARDTESAAEAVASVVALGPLDREGRDLVARRDIASVLTDLLAGKAEPSAAAARVEAVLDFARQAGCLEVVERYAGLARALRGAGGAARRGS
ncbi:MAG: hypothetical protein D6731_04955 [Planctomycetota bacterium]|nr:MAG: hypothetical protein D6731_04955 [Planctomycetota bacterium]